MQGGLASAGLPQRLHGFLAVYLRPVMYSNAWQRSCNCQGSSWVSTIAQWHAVSEVASWVRLRGSVAIQPTGAVDGPMSGALRQYNHPGYRSTRFGLAPAGTKQGQLAVFSKYELEDGTVVQVQGLEASSSSSGGGEQEAAGAAPAALPVPSPEQLEAAEAAVKEQADRIRAMKEVEGLKNAVRGANGKGMDAGVMRGAWGNSVRRSDCRRRHPGVTPPLWRGTVWAQAQ